MSTTQTEQVPTGDQPGGPASKRKKWAAILTPALLIALVGLLFGDNLVQQWQERHDKDKPPSFEISAINTLGERNVYEITNHIKDLTPDAPVTITWGLQVIPIYRGDMAYGEVRVLVKDKQGQVLADGKWDDLDKDSKTLLIPLDPYRLSRDVERLAGGFQENIFGGGKFTPPETILDVEIVRANLLNAPVVTDTLVIRNAPWYHYAAASAWHGDSMDVYVYGKNLGGPSDFAVVGEVFEIREIPGSALDEWPWVDYQHIFVSNVGSGKEFTATLSFPENDRFEFEEDKAYFVNVYLVKKQNYIKFSDGAWQHSGNKWRLGSFSSQLLVVP